MTDTIGLRFRADGEVEMSEHAARKLLESVTSFAAANPRLTAVVAIACYPAYARLAAAKHRRMRIMSIVGMALDYVSDQVYERLQQDYGPTVDEEIGKSWKDKPVERPAN